MTIKSNNVLLMHLNCVICKGSTTEIANKIPLFSILYSDEFKIVKLNII